ncbi:Nucleolar complex protein 4 [Chionoecetes opilio]|uniref:Nucleolar complex protein 4 n=1 Tax=Chionoecetes opilio TaxID=41210 RepID=A0A8J4XT21_CHIOP|nr:Nucleolar complex protein 4 [Chionoecetes opilio]
MLCDRFLASTHLPEYLAASFIKRLARLSLLAPSSCLHLLIKFIINMLLRFPGLQRLIHNTAVTDLHQDPYQATEKDPAYSRAGESSLWEVASLHHHGLPSVSKAAAFTQKHSLPQGESDLGAWVEQGYEELFERATKINVKDKIPITFMKPQGLFHHPEGTMGGWWTLPPMGNTGAPIED